MCLTCTSDFDLEHKFMEYITGKVYPVDAIRACWGSTGIAPLILNLGTR